MRINLRGGGDIASNQDRVRSAAITRWNEHYGAGEAIPGPTRALDGRNEENHLEEIKTPQRGF